MLCAGEISCIKPPSLIDGSPMDGSPMDSSPVDASPMDSRPAVEVCVTAVC